MAGMFRAEAWAGGVRVLVALCFLGVAGCEKDEDSLRTGDVAIARERIRFPVVDDAMAAVPPGAEASIEALAAFIAERFESGPERAYAVYRWIRDHIANDVGQLGAGDIDPATQTPEAVFASRQAVCDGYSRLFGRLVAALGLTFARISGYGVMTTYVPGSDLADYEHVWNAVSIDGQWFLVDASWDTSEALDGSSDPNFFFFTDPARFVVRHFPHDPQWQLLSPRVAEADFWARVSP